MIVSIHASDLETTTVLGRTAVVMVAKASDNRPRSSYPKAEGCIPNSTEELDIQRPEEAGEYQPEDLTTNSTSSSVLKISENGLY